MGCCKKKEGEVKTSVTTYTYLTVLAMMINYAVGTGILNLPHTIASASYGVAIIFTLFISFITYLLAQYSLESCSMTFALVRSGRIQTDIEGDPDAGVVIQENAFEGATESIILGDSPNTKSTPNFYLGNEVVYQMSTQCEFYGGKAGFYVYQISIIAYYFGCIWSYGSVIAQSFTSVIPMYALPNHVKGTTWVCADPCQNYAQACSDSYWIWICITIVFGSVFVFFNLGNQKFLQMFFTGCRFVELALAAILIIYCLATQPFLPNKDGQSPYKNGNFLNPNVPAFSWNTAAIGSLISSLTFAQMYHPSLPSIFQFTKQSHQKKLPTSVYASAIFMISITFLIALPGGLYFGNDGANLVIINFNNWNGSKFENGIKQPPFIAFLSYLIRLLPPIYVLGGVPINSQTMALNIMELIPESKRHKMWLRAIINLLCVIPALILGGFVRCLGLIIDIVGLFGYFLMAAPALVAIRAKRWCRQEFGVSKSFMASCLSNEGLMWFCVAVNAVSLVLTIYSLIVTNIRK